MGNYPFLFGVKSAPSIPLLIDNQACLGGAYYTTIFEPNSDADVGKANRHTPGNVVTYPRQDPFHYTISAIDELAQTNGLVLTHINHWNHPKDQRMLKIMLHPLLSGTAPH